MTAKRMFKSLKNGTNLEFSYKKKNKDYTIRVEEVKNKFRLYTFVFDGNDVFDDGNYTEEKIREYVKFESLINIIRKEFPGLIKRTEKNSVSLKGFRKITVDNSIYFWKFDRRIIIVNQSIKNSYLTVDIGWFDEWLYVNDKESKPPEFEIKKVTPKFVAKCIRYALSNQWSEGKMDIVFRNGKLKK